MTHKNPFIVNNNILDNCLYTDFKPHYNKSLLNLGKIKKDFITNIHCMDNCYQELKNNIIYFRHCWLSERNYKFDWSIMKNINTNKLL